MTAICASLLLALAAPTGATADEPTEELPPGIVELHVEDLHCNGCAKKLARKLYAAPGVKKVKASVADDKATITLQQDKEPDLAKLWEAAKQAGQVPVALLVADRRYEASDFEESSQP